MPLVGETARAALNITSYADAGMPRLAGLAWATEGLTAAIGAVRQYDLKGGWSDPFRFVRAQTLLTAHAGGLMAIEALHGDGEDIKGLKLAARAARADGFTGMFASNPAQVAEINAEFTPADSGLDQDRQIEADFDDAADEVVTPITLRRPDLPTLKIGKQILGSGLEPRGGEISPMRVLRTT